MNRLLRLRKISLRLLFHERAGLIFSFWAMSQAEINNLFQVDYQIFLVSVDQCMQSFAQGEFQLPTVTDVYWETVKHYHDRGPPSPTRSL